MASPNYGDNLFEKDLEPFATKLQPAVDQSDIFLGEGTKAGLQGEMSAAQAGIAAAEGAMAGWQGVASGFRDISAGIAMSEGPFRAALAGKAEAAKTNILGGFQQEVLLIADAVDQGLSPAAARMRLRALNAEYTANNPSLLDDINTLQAKLTQTAGLADIVTTGNEEFQLRKKLTEDAITNGWQGPGMSEDDAVNNMLAAKRSAESMAALEREFRQKQIMRQEITEADQFKATQVLRGFVENSYPWVLAQVDTARAAFDGGGDPAAIIQKLKDDVNAQMANAGFLRTMGGEADVNYLITGVEKLITATEDYILGKTDQTVTTNNIAKIKAHQELMLRADPELGPLLSASELLGNMNSVLTQQISSRVLDIFGKQAVVPVTDDFGRTSYESKPADLVGQDGDIGRYLVSTIDGMKNLLATPTETGNIEVTTHLTNILRSVKAFGGSAEDARDFRAVVEFFADPTVGQYATQNNGVIPQHLKDEATYVIQEQYEKVLLPLIRNEYENNAALLAFPGLDMLESATGQKLEASTTIIPVWNGSGVEFRAAEGYENNVAVQSAVDSMNSGENSIARPLNMLIRAEAHMQGNTDYKRVYEEDLMERLWGAEGSDELEGNAGDDRLDIDELAGGNIPLNLSRVEPPSDQSYTPASISGKAGQLLDAIGQAEGADYTTVYGYATNPGNEFEDRNITTMTLNELQKFQKELVKHNGASSAAGKYQIIRPTLRLLIQKMGLTGEEVFTPQLQDAMALYLLQNDTSFNNWMMGRGDKEKFQNELAGIWASVPDITGKSAYAGDGLNAATSGGQNLIGML